SLEQAQSAFAAYPNIEVIDNITEGKFPTATTAANQDTVQVGRLRLDHQGNRLWVWQVCDNLRKGAALNAVQIIENLFLNSPTTFVGD
ncbi:MAG: Asd/ArgC dimerization domain-containing protein, partial [Planctomycetota bacterium]|nr:Asd/ArgC dimerization domain-containing protein [Planctomycetota bacterium]